MTVTSYQNITGQGYKTPKVFLQVSNKLKYITVEAVKSQIFLPNTKHSDIHSPLFHIMSDDILPVNDPPNTYT